MSFYDFKAYLSLITVGRNVFLAYCILVSISALRCTTFYSDATVRIHGNTFCNSRSVSCYNPWSQYHITLWREVTYDPFHGIYSCGEDCIGSGVIHCVRNLTKVIIYSLEGAAWCRVWSYGNLNYCCITNTWCRLITNLIRYCMCTWCRITWNLKLTCCRIYCKVSETSIVRNCDIYICRCYWITIQTIITQYIHCSSLCY